MEVGGTPRKVDDLAIAWNGVKVVGKAKVIYRGWLSRNFTEKEMPTLVLIENSSLCFNKFSPQWIVLMHGSGENMRTKMSSV